MNHRVGAGENLGFCIAQDGGEIVFGGGVCEAYVCWFEFAALLGKQLDAVMSGQGDNTVLLAVEAFDHLKRVFAY